MASRGCDCGSRRGRRAEPSQAISRSMAEQEKQALWPWKPRCRRSCGVKEGRTSAFLHCRNCCLGAHDCPLGAGIHAAAHPVLGSGGDRLREQAFALSAFAGQFPRPSNGLGLPTSLGLGRLLVSSTGLHLAKDALALHLLFERLQRLIDVVVPDDDNYDLKLSIIPQLWFNHAGWCGSIS